MIGFFVEVDVTLATCFSIPWNPRVRRGCTMTTVVLEGKAVSMEVYDEAIILFRFDWSPWCNLDEIIEKIAPLVQSTVGLPKKQLKVGLLNVDVSQSSVLPDADEYNEIYDYIVHACIEELGKFYEVIVCNDGPKRARYEIGKSPYEVGSHELSLKRKLTLQQLASIINKYALTQRN